MYTILQYLFAGLVATILMDVWAEILKRQDLHKVNWQIFGRWVGHMRKGKFWHEDIALATPIEGESNLGWMMHYCVGLAYGLFYYWATLLTGLEPGISFALIFSLTLLIMPWLIMQPAFGLGLFARRVQNPWKIRLVNISIHFVFGIGLYTGLVLFTFI